MRACLAGPDETLGRGWVGRGCCAPGFVALDDDPPAEGALPADGHGTRDAVGVYG